MCDSQTPLLHILWIVFVGPNGSAKNEISQREHNIEIPMRVSVMGIRRAEACLPSLRVNVQPESGSTPVRETLGNRRRDRGAGDRRHPSQRLLRYEIRARPRVGHDRLSQIASAVVTEVTAVANVGPELLGCVRSVTRPAQCHRMIRTQCEEQRSEANEHQHDARIVVLGTRACQAGWQNRLVEGVDSGG